MQRIRQAFDKAFDVLNGEILETMLLKTISIEGFQLSYLQYKTYESIKVSDTFLKT